MYSISEEWPDSSQEHKGGFNLFTKEDFWKLRKSEIDYLPISVKNSVGELVAFWCFAQLENEWKAPYQAPYFEPFSKDATYQQQILSQIISYLKHKRNQTIAITLPPLFLLKNKSLVNNFIKEGATIENIEITSYLLVSHENSFSDIIRRRRKKRQLKSLLNSNLSIQELKPDAWNFHYELLLKWRNQKGHKNLVSAEYMDEAKVQAPSLFRGLVLTNELTTIGIAIFLQVKKNCYYVYALITDPIYQKEGFSLLLWNELYQLAQKENVQFIDMGTSMNSPRVINRSLLQNKISIGGVLSRKYSIKC